LCCALNLAQLKTLLLLRHLLLFLLLLLLRRHLEQLRTQLRLMLLLQLQQDRRLELSQTCQLKQQLLLHLCFQEKAVKQMSHHPTANVSLTSSLLVLLLLVMLRYLKQLLHATLTSLDQ
jgi:hypothetical protein